jgi:hypothetical protein
MWIKIPFTLEILEPRMYFIGEFDTKKQICAYFNVNIEYRHKKGGNG